MNPIFLIALALALAMDACAVAIAVSLALKSPSRAQSLKLSFHFGFFQFLMPIVGWLAGRGLVAHVSEYSHWFVFGILVAVGGRMIHEGRVRGALGGERRVFEGDPTSGASLLMLSLATSIDALAVGLSLSFLGARIIYPSFVIGLVAFLLSLLGMRFGPFLGRVFGKRMEDAGGFILIALGAAILLAHFVSGYQR